MIWRDEHYRLYDRIKFGVDQAIGMGLSIDDVTDIAREAYRDALRDRWHILRTVRRTCPACGVYKPRTGSPCQADTTGQTTHDDDEEPPMPETVVLPGRDLDVAVARALGFVEYVGAAVPEIARHRDEPVESLRVWMRSSADFYCATCGTLPEYSTDDATALRHIVPWLRGRGYDIDVHFYGDARREWVEVHAFKPHTTLENADAAMDGPNALAAALCQVIVAVSKESGNA